jgi:hypothetical protein
MLFMRVFDVHGDQVVTAVRLAHGTPQVRARDRLIARHLEVGYEEYHGAPM